MTENQDNHELNDNSQADDSNDIQKDDTTEQAADIESKIPKDSPEESPVIETQADCEPDSQNSDDDSGSISEDASDNSDQTTETEPQVPEDSPEESPVIETQADSEPDSQNSDDDSGSISEDASGNPNQSGSEKAGSGRDNRNVQADNRGKKTVQKGGKKPDKYRKHILCRYGKMGNLGYFAHDQEDFPDKATHVIVNTERGLEIAQIVAHDTCHKKGNFTVKESKINKYCKDSCDNFPLDRKGTVVRVATEQDVREQQHLEDGVAKELNYCNQLIAEQNLEMTLIDAERLFGGERIIFYFMAEGRVDFRQLVKDLAQQYQTRIEMRQIGARDEARLVADFETCGRECCCRSFLKVLYPVNMRMAKLQKATLDPSKISGRCGRLKCCLRFEDEVYNEHKKKLPKKNSIVLTQEGHGKVIDTHVLTLLVKVFLTESSRLVVVDLEDILEFNYTPPAKPEKPAEEEKPRDSARNERSRSRNKDRNYNGKSKNGNGEEAGGKNDDRQNSRQKNDNDQDGSQQSEDGENKPKKKRRRRRRKKKPSTGGDGNNNSGSSSDQKSSGGESSGGESSGGND